MQHENQGPYAVVQRVLSTLFYLSTDSTNREAAWSGDRLKAIRFRTAAQAREHADRLSLFDDDRTIVIPFDPFKVD